MESSTCCEVSIALLTLPTEIRMRIFYLALLPVSIHIEADIRTSAPTYSSLQLTCQSIREETRLLPFQKFPLDSPAHFGTNLSTTIASLRRMQPWQVKAIRRIDLSLMGSVFEIFEAGRVITSLCEGSDLQQLNIQLTARDVMMPMADSVTGMRKALDVDNSPVFTELIKNRTSIANLRRLNVLLQLGPNFKDDYDNMWAEAWQGDLQKKLNAASGVTLVDVQVSIKRCPKLASIMQAYFTALADDFDWAGSAGEVVAVQASIGAQLLDLHTSQGR
jgi:hypothetical protein